VCDVTQPEEAVACPFRTAVPTKILEQSEFSPGTLVILRTASFNVYIFYGVPTQCFYMLGMDLRINSDYFPIQHYLTGCYNRNGLNLDT
jgi:hypothetical protein